MCLHVCLPRLPLLSATDEGILAGLPSRIRQSDIKFLSVSRSESGDYRRAGIGGAVLCSAHHRTDRWWPYSNNSQTTLLVAELQFRRQPVVLIRFYRLLHPLHLLGHIVKILVVCLNASSLARRPRESNWSREPWRSATRRGSGFLCPTPARLFDTTPTLLRRSVRLK